MAIRGQKLEQDGHKLESSRAERNSFEFIRVCLKFCSRQSHQAADFPFFHMSRSHKQIGLTRMKTAAAKGTARFGAYEKCQLPECLMAVLSSLVSSVQSRGITGNHQEMGV
eukprot:s271_g42.t1